MNNHPERDGFAGWRGGCAAAGTIEALVAIVLTMAATQLVANSGLLQQMEQIDRLLRLAAETAHFDHTLRNGRWFIEERVDSVVIRAADQFGSVAAAIVDARIENYTRNRLTAVSGRATPAHGIEEPNGLFWFEEILELSHPLAPVIRWRFLVQSR